MEGDGRAPSDMCADLKAKRHEQAPSNVCADLKARCRRPVEIFRLAFHLNPPRGSAIISSRSAEQANCPRLRFSQSISMHRPSLLAPPRPLPLPFLPPPRPHWRFPRGPAVLHRPPRTRLDATSRRPLPILALLSSRSMVHSLHHLFPSLLGNTASLTPFLIEPVAVAAEGVLGSSEEGSDDQEAKFVEVGYVSSTHGIKGELRVMPSTDFPELRFCTVWSSYVYCSFARKCATFDGCLVFLGSHLSNLCILVSCFYWVLIWFSLFIHFLLWIRCYSQGQDGWGPAFQGRNWYQKCILQVGEAIPGRRVGLLVWVGSTPWTRYNYFFEFVFGGMVNLGWFYYILLH